MRLVLNLLPSEQRPERAYDELRAEYGDMQRLAGFYERTHCKGRRPAATALAATLREVEDVQNGGQPFPDHDAKLVRQFMRGLTDEEAFIRIGPLSFRELQAELRNLAGETKRFTQTQKSFQTGANGWY